MDLGSMISLTNSLAQQNNAWSAQQAQKQMDFQERMSNTAHQREVADLKAAGLNPILSAKLNGASTPSGASGETDNSNVGAIVELLKEFGEGIAQATAKGAMHGASKTPENDVIDSVMNHETSAKQLELMEKRMQQIDKRDSKVTKQREKDQRLLNQWSIESGNGLTKKDYWNNFLTAATMASAAASPMLAPKLAVPAIIAAYKKIESTAKQASKNIKK